MTRAFMSRPGNRSMESTDTGSVGQWVYTMDSEREARAILAEVENEQVGDYQRLTWLGDWSDDVAALISAFVNE